MKMNWKPKLALLLLIAFAVMPAAAQGVRYDSKLQNAGGAAIAGATVTVCSVSASGQPCSPTVTIYNDSGLSSQKSNPFLTDANGNYGFWIAPGTYQVTLTGGGIFPLTMTITPGCIPGATGCVGGSGSVTSVAMTVPSVLTVTGSPITTTGTLALTFTGGQTQNQFLATPNGAAGALGLRAVVEADLPAATVFTDQNATFGAHAYDFSAASSFKGRVGAGLATTGNGGFGYDSTNGNWHFWNGADVIMAPLAAGFVSGDCPEPTLSVNSWTLADSGSPCGTGTGGGSPGGLDTAVQVAHPAGTFFGDATNFSYNATTHNLTITGAMTTAASSFVLSQLVNPANAGDAICGNSTPAWSDCVPGVSGRTVAVATDTLTNSDRQQMVTYNSASAVATSIATAASLGNSYVVYLRNVNSGTVTITPAAGSSINNGSSATVPEGYHCTLSSQDNVNYDLDCSGGILLAGTNVTITQGPFGQTISATGGGGGLSGMTAGQIPVAATATTVTSSKALAGTDADIATAAGALTNGATACGDANGGVTTTGCAGGSNFGGTNTQTVGYTLTSSDAGKLVVMNCSAACTLTAPATQPSTTASIYLMSTNSNATFALGGADTYNGTTTVPLLLPFTILKISADSASATNYVGAYNGLSFDGAHTATITPASGTSTIIQSPSGDSLVLKAQGNAVAELNSVSSDVELLSNSSTKHDIMGNGMERAMTTVAFSATPAFNAGQDEVFEMTLTGNVTSSTITNLGPGEFVTFTICQDATGGRTFAFPTSPTFRGAGTISSTASTCSTQRFWYDGTNMFATNAMVTGE